ncbi:MAG TPA: patatin-like phospholipase family protein [Gemmatimonadales bacterium]|nr:patatin-like phospholipase family protein [Gemmatimonadales bacterium]
MDSSTRFTLVFGGGGMKGLAHIGVLQALTERGLRPAHIVGSSVGALIGAAWAAGRSIPELRDMAVSLKRKEVFAVAHADMAFKRMHSPALFRREPLETLIARLVQGAKFPDLDPPVVVNTVDINSGMQVMWGLPGLDDVPLADAIFASCALPGYFAPREIHGRFYVDGATTDNLPIGAARALSGELVVAVDVSASSALREDTQDEGFASVFARATEIAMQTQLEMSLHDWATPPLFHIHPRVEHISMFSFSHLREVVEEGYRATLAALDRPADWPARGSTGVYPRRRVTVRVERDRCIGCGQCLVHAPQGMFVLDTEGKAVVTRPDQEWSPADGGFIRHCPTYAISARPAQSTQERAQA